MRSLPNSSATSGKPRVDALGTELLPAALLCRYYPRLARRVLRPQRIRGSSILFFNKRSLLVREHYGVIGIISPWNYSFGIPMHELVQALLAGNTAEALHWANDSRLGLCASIWTRDRRQARQLSKQLQAGVIMINDHLMSHGMPETPWGGYKQSSIGRCHGEQGFHEVTRAKVVVDDLLHRVPKNFWWLPYADSLEQGIVGAIDALFARALGRRLRGLLHLLGSYLGSFKSTDT